MIRTYLFNKEELENISWNEASFSDDRKNKIARLKREDSRQLSVCAELLLMYAVKNEIPDITFPLNIREDERKKLRFEDLPFYFNLSHAKDYAACAFSDEPIGVDIEYFRVKELMNPNQILHPEEVRLLQFISDSGEKKKYFYECWVAKESYLKNLGIGLIVRPRDFMVHEDKLMIGDEDFSSRKGHHVPKKQLDTSKNSELNDNLSYLEPRYVHVFEPGEIRGTNWKFDAGYRLAICSMKKDADTKASVVHAEQLKEMLDLRN